MTLDFCFCNWSLSNWVSLFGLIVSIGTFILGYLAYKKFLLKQFRERQLQVVCDLINHINGEWNHFELKNLKSQFRMNAGNFFDIAEFPEVTEEANFYTFAAEEESRFYPDRGVVAGVEYDTKDQTIDEILRFDFFLYHNHPLLPISIARVLKKFSISYWEGSIKYGNIQKQQKYVIMGKKIMRDKDTLCYYYSDKKTWREFVDLCKELKDVIIKWGEENGLYEMNISHSHNFNHLRK